jgi:hypothetical protein
MVSMLFYGFCTGTAPGAAELHGLYIKSKQGKATLSLCQAGSKYASFTPLDKTHSVMIKVLLYSSVCL